MFGLPLGEGEGRCGRGGEDEESGGEHLEGAAHERSLPIRVLEGRQGNNEKNALLEHVRFTGCSCSLSLWLSNPGKGGKAIRWVEI